MPEFAQADPQAFWIAADAHERANGRTYTELQIALPRELGKADREELAREATRELLGGRFAYTLAVHAPLAKDNIDQPHMHLMFSERAVDKTTRGLAEDRFFKRNGAKKDPAWNDRNKPDEVREKWVELMNAAMEKVGIEQRMDARSWANQGREDLHELREPKLLGGDGLEAAELRQKVDDLRHKREELPAPHLDQAAAAEQIDREGRKAIAEVEKRRDQELSILEKLIEKAKEMAEVARAFVQRGVEAVRERVQGPGSREIEPKAGMEAPVAKTAVPPSRSEIDDGLARQLEHFRAMGRAGKAERDRKEELLRPKPEPVPEKQKELELEQSRGVKKQRAIEGHSL